MHEQGTSSKAVDWWLSPYTPGICGSGRPTRFFDAERWYPSCCGWLILRTQSAETHLSWITVMKAMGWCRRDLQPSAPAR